MGILCPIGRFRGLVPRWRGAKSVFDTRRSNHLWHGGLDSLNRRKSRRGAHWARWLFVVIYALGSAGFSVLFIVMPQEFLSLPIVMQACGLIQVVLQTCALILMFSRASRQWFNAPYAVA